MMRPSTALRALLARLLGPDHEHHLGDLDEEAAGRFPTPSWRAELWYLREATSLLLAHLRTEVTAPSTPRRPSRPPMFDALRSDIRSTLRGLRRAPGVAVVITGTLAISTASVLVMFAVADKAFLRPLPYPEEDQLVRLYSGFDGGANTVDAVSPLDLRGITAAAGIVARSAAWTIGETVHRTDGVEPVRVRAPRASASLLPLLGLKPLHGRWFDPQEEVPGTDRSVVLANGYWREAFGGDPEAVGRTLTLDGEEYRIVGVAPAVGMLPQGVDLWRALALGPEWYEEERWGWQMLGAVARLTPGTSLDVASAELNRRFVEETERARDDGQVRVLQPLRTSLVGETRAGIALLAFGVALLLGMACLNVIGVLLARAEDRRREFGLRRALGAAGRGLGRLVLVETTLFAVIGTGVGLMLARALLSGISRWGADALSALDVLGPLSIDLRVFAAALGLLVGVSALVGAAPIVSAVSTGTRGLLSGSTWVAGSKGTTRLRGGVVTAQIAVSMVLLVAVGFSWAAYRRVASADLGFNPEGVLTVEVELPAGTPRDETFALYRETLDRIAALPGVTSAGAGEVLPLDGVMWSGSFEIERPDREGLEPGGMMRPVMPGYFRTMGIPLEEGRAFDERDVDGATPAVIVDRTIVNRFFPDGDPIGRQVRVFGLAQDPATVIGVVGNVPTERPDEADAGHVYFSLLQRARRTASFVVRTGEGDAAGQAEAVRAVLREASVPLAVTRVVTMESLVAASMAGPRFGLALLGLLGAGALILATVGIYGVLAFTVARRTRELGTRVALGAAPDRLMRDVVRQAMVYWGGGVAWGGALSAVAARWLTRLVVEFDGVGALAWIGTPLVLAVVAVVAAVVPARRAVRIDPVEALRAE